MNNKLRVIGLTGGLASGKSTVAKMFADLGAVTLDADLIGHKALGQNSPCYEKIKKRFGSKVLDDNGTINRKKLAEVAFKNTKEQKALCAIIHPWVFDYIDKKIIFYHKDKDLKLLIVEAVLLIESGLYRKMDLNIVVKAKQSQQLLRTKLNRNMDGKSAKQRMRYQLKQSEKIRYADYVIDNRGTFKNTESQVKKIAVKLLKN
ncbi:MAG: dephospho-CoA kinase [Candidatus Omnitrophica bacterium]|nr:dephospho-CoA kinase [Candidatus Omnitrophota bacterium]